MNQEFTIYCPNCQQAYLVTQEQVGLQTQCQNCQTYFTVPILGRAQLLTGSAAAPQPPTSSQAPEVPKWYKSSSIKTLLCALILAVGSGAIYWLINHNSVRTEKHDYQADAISNKSSEKVIETPLTGIGEGKSINIAEGLSWLEAAEKSAQHENYFAAAMMAGRAIGYLGYGRKTNDPNFPVYISPIDANIFRSARSQLDDYLSKTKLPIWFSPVREHHNISIECVRFSPDGNTVASAGNDSVVRLWDVRTGDLIKELKAGLGSWVGAVAFSPDGRCIASGRSNSVILWDIEAEEIIREFDGHPDTVQCVAFCQNGTVVGAGGRDHSVWLWDVETGKAIGRPLEGHSSNVYGIDLSPDGKRVVTGSSDRTIRLWDVDRGEMISKHTVGGQAVLSVKYSPDGETIASGLSNNMIRLWDANSGEPIGSPFKGHQSAVRCVAFSPDGKTIVSGSYDRTIRLWNVNSGRAIGAPIRSPSGVDSIDFNSDAKTIVSCAGYTIHLWDINTGLQVGEKQIGHSGSVYDVAFSPDRRSFISLAGDGIRLWKVQSNAPAGKLLDIDNPSSLAYSPNGKFFVVGTTDGDIIFVDDIHGNEKGKRIHAHSKSISSISFSPDGELIASGSRDKSARLWDVESRTAAGNPLTGHDDDIQHVTFTSDGKTIAAGTTKTIRLWDVRTKQATGQAFSTDKGNMYSFDFSPDGETIASAIYGGPLYLWDVRTGKGTLRSLPNIYYKNSRVLFNPNGKEIVAATCHPGTILFLDVKADQKHETASGYGSIRDLVFSSDGKAILTGSRNQSIGIFNALPRVLNTDLMSYLTSDCYTLTKSRFYTVFWDSDGLFKEKSHPYINAPE